MQFGQFNLPDITSIQRQVIIEKSVINLLGSRVDSYCEMIDTDILWTYREFDRHLFSHFDQGYITRLTNDIIDNGFKEAIMLEYNPFTCYCRIGEGNHRLAIAVALGVDKIPVFGIRSGYMEPHLGHGGKLLEERVLYPSLIVDSKTGRVFDVHYPSYIKVSAILPEVAKDTRYIWSGTGNNYREVGPAELAYLKIAIQPKGK